MTKRLRHLRGILPALALGALLIPQASATTPTAETAGYRPAAVLPCPPPCGDGYRLGGGDGGVFTFGDAPFAGSAAALRLQRDIVDVAETPAGRGYWLAGADGGVFTFGEARFFGSLGAVPNKSIVAMAPTPTGAGYWLVGGDGGIFSFGDARFLGSAAPFRLRAPIVDMAATESGDGYWLLAADGGVFAFGDAHFFGSATNVRLSAPAVGIAVPWYQAGYWIATADGGVLPVGGVPDHGSLAGHLPASPIIGIASRSQSPTGYWLVGADGGVFSFGAAPFLGSAVGGLQRPLAAIAPKGPRGEPIAPGSYREASDRSGIAEFHNGIFVGFPSPPPPPHGEVFGPRPPTRVAFTVAGVGPPATGEDPRIEATIYNSSGVPITFPEGLRVVFHVTSQTVPPHDLVALAPSIMRLDPRATATIRTPLGFMGDGVYSISAETTIVLP
jgi:hypothetical protein